MKLKELLKNIEIISSNADMEMEISGICYDSRKAENGSLFVAIKGFASDGHKFIPKALELGASAIVCEDIPEEGEYVQVKDSRKALAAVSREFYGNPASKMTVIGITGTSGKTTSSYLIKHLLEKKLNAKVGLIGTNGNMIGDELIHSEHTTPESLELHGLFDRMLKAGCSHVVMEVSSHSLTLSRVGGMEFDVALYTNLSQDHLDFHKDMEDYAAAKQQLFSMCKKACINADDEWAKFMVEKANCPVIDFSAESNDAALTANDIRLSADGVRFAAVYNNDIAMTKLKIPGHFSVLNALGVMAVGLSLGLSLADCADAMADAEGVKGRLELVPTDGDYSI
ncbi:MAG: UDP-N-acetylmuramoyl-L-alanyl-D-glutamate--2,6-diaminopimelate ligase, partial [Oscillospiraceae bacterium]|nr:UDP-N-acetylmuramoyl-L-alanyl-D-glutamate--2,6-diaminopimelate ligase [Oscillospiraceae bacterium]